MPSGILTKHALALVVCSFSLTGNSEAQQPMDQEAILEAIQSVATRSNSLRLDAESRAMEQCSTTRAVFRLPVFNLSTKREETRDGVVSIEWTGACEEGKRDGPGVLSWQYEHPTSPVYKLTVAITAEGRFVKGRRVGMWCITKLRTAMNGKPMDSPDPLTGTGCYLSVGHDKHPASGLYRKLPDGSWREHAWGGAPTGSSVAAGTLEARSARMLADAAGGKAELKSQIIMQDPVLDGLVHESKIVIALSPAPVPLMEKRVAVVLSSEMVREFERFNRERQALIDASAGLRGEAAEERARFIRVSNPDRLVINILQVLKTHARDVRLADDLAGLKEGGFDFALVVDWKSMTRFDQLGRYRKEAWPEKPSPAISGVACEAFRGFLISRDLEVVRQLPAYPICQTDRSSATGDHAYMWNLATYFSHRWGTGPDDVGLLARGLNDFFRRERP